MNDYLNNNEDKFMHYKKNDIYLSDEQISILNKYNINYNSYSSVQFLLFDIENILNEELYEDLEMVSKEISEFNYYHNTNK